MKATKATFTKLLINSTMPCRPNLRLALPKGFMRDNFGSRLLGVKAIPRDATQGHQYAAAGGKGRAQGKGLSGR